MTTLILARGDNHETVSLPLPATRGEVVETFALLDAISRYAGDARIIHAVSDIPNLAQYVKNTNLNAPDAFSKLNQLAEKIDGMSQRERDMFSGALGAESVNGLDDMLRIAGSLDEYELIGDVSSDRELGGWLVEQGFLQVPDYVRPYLDYAAIGAEYYEKHDGAYTPNGYVRRREATQEQAQGDKPIFQMYLTYGQREYRLDLPADDARLDAARQSLGIGDLAQASIYRVRCETPFLSDRLPMDCVSVEDANELTQAIKEQPDGDLLKYLAVLSAEQPDDFPGALRLILDLDDYERITEGAYEYGQSVLRRIGADDELINTIDGYMDFEKFGEDSMKEDGVRQTEFGIVRRISTPFPNQMQSQQMM